MMPLVIENQLISLGYHVVFHCFLAMMMYEYHLQKKKIIVLNFISLSIIIMRIFFSLPRMSVVLAYFNQTLFRSHPPKKKRRE